MSTRICNVAASYVRSNGGPRRRFTRGEGPPGRARRKDKAGREGCCRARQTWEARCIGGGFTRVFLHRIMYRVEIAPTHHCRGDEVVIVNREARSNAGWAERDAVLIAEAQIKDRRLYVIRSTAIGRIAARTDVLIVLMEAHRTQDISHKIVISGIGHVSKCHGVVVARTASICGGIEAAQICAKPGVGEVRSMDIVAAGADADITFPEIEVITG